MLPRGCGDKVGGASLAAVLYELNFFVTRYSVSNILLIGDKMMSITKVLGFALVGSDSWVPGPVGAAPKKTVYEQREREYETRILAFSHM
jgi:hypothetical protein